MSEEKIVIKIKENGELSLETKGIFGPACIEEINKLIEDLALPLEYQKTDDFYTEITTITKTDHKVKGGLK